MDDDPEVTITLKRSEWNCLIQKMGELLNKGGLSTYSQAHGHYVSDVWRKVKRFLLP